MIDPFCCVDAWDDICADEADEICYLTETCGPDSGSCFLDNGTAGCNNVSCCEVVCALDDYCCTTEWDQPCADKAAEAPECRQ